MKPLNDCSPLQTPNAGNLARQLRELQELSTTNLNSIALTLNAQLGANVGAGVTTGSDSYQVPPDQALVIYQIQSVYRSNALAVETLPALFSAPGMEDLMLTRLSNVLCELSVKDRKLVFFENKSLNLGAIYKRPLYLPQTAPLLLPPGITLKAAFDAQDATADTLGQNGVVELILSGVSLPVRV